MTEKRDERRAKPDTKRAPEPEQQSKDRPQQDQQRKDGKDRAGGVPTPVSPKRS